MKSLLLILLLLIIPFSSAFSASDFLNEGKDFFGDYFSLTGSVIVKLTGKITDIGGGSFENINPDYEHKYDGCIDEDRINPKFKGICKSDNKKNVDYCSEDKMMVYEYFCNNGCVGSWRICESHCENGACI
jgi:hypothetical protein